MFWKRESGGIEPKVSHTRGRAALLRWPFIIIIIIIVMILNVGVSPAKDAFLTPQDDFLGILPNFYTTFSITVERLTYW